MKILKFNAKNATVFKSRQRFSNCGFFALVPLLMVVHDGK